jgi:hypothetical protein
MNIKVINHWKTRYTKARNVAYFFMLTFLALGLFLVLMVNRIENTIKASVCYQLNNSIQAFHDCIKDN